MLQLRAYVPPEGAESVQAGVGVLDGSSILVVGAMALSPDLLPMSATAGGLVERRWVLAVRATFTLCIGLGAAVLTAAATTAALRVVGRIEDDLVLDDSVLGPSLTEGGPGAAVGVAISVTTIPAAAYIGCAIGLRRLWSRCAGGADDERRSASSPVAR